MVNTVCQGNDSRLQDALKIKGKTIDDTALADNKILKYDLASQTWKCEDETGGGYSEAQINALHSIGIANKRWINCTFDGASVSDSVNVFDAIRNIGAVDMYLTFVVPLPYTIGTGATLKNLVITRFKVGIAGATGGDKITRIRMNGWSDHDSNAILVTEDEDRVAAGEYITDHADVTVGGNQEKVNWLIDTVCSSTPNELAISYFKVEYYYDD
ncbi:hypothetical protein QKV40_gp01 [Varidnaviria sp.]|uniref:Uncharacterized protein n=1 Tax=Lokiarchaeia virus SkuldV1 TaxID=3058189 RepID=A0AA46RJC3_9VIRU|nr:hypothetical protein QKV40_gp01 [Varidnaviria sp.]UPO70955.1 hypothetical protein 11324_00001 [Lokiarchaeia virus SkuldV1]